MTYRRADLNRAIFGFLMYAFSVQAATVCGKLAGPANAGSSLAMRFDLVIVMVFFVCFIRSATTRNWEIFRPGDLKMRSAQALCQVGQTVCTLFASFYLPNQVQAGASLVLVPVWVLLLAYAQRQPVRVTAWSAPAMYGVIAVLMAMGSTSPEFSKLAIGLGIMAISGFCTASLQYLTRATAEEPKLKTLLWQHSLGAVLVIPLWFTPVSALRLNQASVGWDTTTVMVLGVAVWNTAQLIFLQVAYRGFPKEFVVKLTALRGTQIYFGYLATAGVAGFAFNAQDLLALVLAAGAMTAQWRTAPQPPPSDADRE